MATFAARKLTEIAENVANILAIELLAAAQGVDLRTPYGTSPALQHVMRAIRKVAPHYDSDRYFSPDITSINQLVRSGTIASPAPFSFAFESSAKLAPLL